MAKYKKGQLISSKWSRGLVFKVVNMNLATHSLRVVKARYMSEGVVRHIPRHIVETNTELMPLEDNV